MTPPTTHYPPLTELVAFAHSLADVAGDIIRPYFGAHGEVESKSDTSPVTIADREAEAAIRRLIQERFPEHGIYGEEFGQEVSSRASLVVSNTDNPSSVTTHNSQLTTHDYTWLIDPIDGTRAFIAGRKEWGTLIALCENGVPILGILDQPVTGERWVGVSGQATLYFDGTRPHHPSLKLRMAGPEFAQEQIQTSPKGEVAPAEPDVPNTRRSVTSPLGEIEMRLGVSGEGGQFIRTRPCATLGQAEFSTTSANYFTPVQAARVVKLAQACRATVRDGDCYAYGLLARGLRDMVVDAGLKPYDILALVPIIEGAGGKITGWDGAPVTLTHYRDVVAVGDATRLAETLCVLKS